MTGTVRRGAGIAQVGFTLIELAIVLALIGLLVGMMVVPLSTQVDQQRIGETQRKLDLIREAVTGFAVANGRLPCPATATTPNTTAGAGTENKPATACGIVEGVVPWATLGLPETDAWGNRFTYRVTIALADDPVAGMLASFALADVGDITVNSGVVNGSIVIAANIPALFVSHGKNGLGAYRPDGTQVGSAAGDELENSNANVPAIFVSRIPSPDFDDLVSWVPLNVLKGRMVASNRLP
jgi:prepilin-type N-terminal cleavage/methylation domain-containing protein